MEEQFHVNGTFDQPILVIPDDVIKIADDAYFNCDEITHVTIGKNVKMIGSYAFGNCESIEEITCLASTPPELGEYVFDFDTCSTAVLRVPAESIGLYDQCGGLWGEFENIKPI